MRPCCPFDKQNSEMPPVYSVRHQKYAQDMALASQNSRKLHGEEAQTHDKSRKTGPRTYPNERASATLFLCMKVKNCFDSFKWIEKIKKIF